MLCRGECVCCVERSVHVCCVELCRVECMLCRGECMLCRVECVCCVEGSVYAV